MFRLSVIKGPDQGKSQIFHSTRVTIGNDARNDFALSDAMVSRFHGVFEERENDEYVFRDLGSLNGSYLRCGDTRHKLHDRDNPQSAEIKDQAQLALGQTLVQIELNPTKVRIPTSVGLSSVSFEETAEGERPTEPGLRESIVRRVQDTPDRVASRITPSADRLQVLFALSRELNALNDIEQILDRVCTATFDMFPLANFFAIMVPAEAKDSSGPMRPLFVRTRDQEQGRELILSQSLLREVVEKRESVLFVRDNLTNDDTRKSIVMAQITACLAAPLFGQRKLMGVMQVDSRGRSGMFGYDDLDLFTVLASSAAFSMERATLTRNIYEMFEAFVHASVAAIDARDPTTAGHSQRVADYTLLTAHAVNESSRLEGVQFTETELTELRYAALLHDFGKIGVREEVLQKASRLMPGTFTTLIQRIETMRALSHQRALERFRDAITTGNAPPSELAKLEAQGIAIERQLDLFRDTVIALQEGVFLTDDHKAVIEQMRAARYLDARGSEISLVNDNEARDLLIERGTLNDEERRHIESHARLSREYLARIPWSSELAQIPCIAGQHHEKLDGSGYPEGLNAAEIPYGVRIMTIADIFDALTANDRPYKKARPVDKALWILKSEVDEGKLDNDLFEIFAQDVVPAVRDRVGISNLG